MLLHAHNMSSAECNLWVVFHVPTCERLKGVLWVDDVAAQWAELVLSPSISGWTEHVHQAQKITIIPASYLVLIDPVDDCEDTTKDLKHEIVSNNV